MSAADGISIRYLDIKKVPLTSESVSQSVSQPARKAILKSMLLLTGILL